MNIFLTVAIRTFWIQQKNSFLDRKYNAGPWKIAPN